MYQFITNMCIGPVLLSLEILSLPDVDWQKLSLTKKGPIWDT